MMVQSGTLPHSLASRCGGCVCCNLRGLCLPECLAMADVESLQRIVSHGRPLPPGGILYRIGDAFESIYVVRSGSFKTLHVTEQGAEQVTGFYLPGEIVGFDGIDEGTHQSTAIALETTGVCRIPFQRLEALCRMLPALQHRLLRTMSGEICANHHVHQVLAQCSADERLALMLLNLSRRVSRRQGISPLRFRLPMPRADLSNYLGLVPETLSRLFRRFCENGWISSDGRELALKDIAALRAVADGNIQLARDGTDPDHLAAYNY